MKHPHCSAYSIKLEPDQGNNMCSRSGFYIHGDSKTNPGTTSTGYIILDKKYREQMWNSNNKNLEVI